MVTAASRVLFGTAFTDITTILPRAAGVFFLLILLYFYGRLAARSAARARLTTQPFGIPDALCAGILALWMISILWQSLGKTGAITLQAILVNSAVYGSLILGVFGVMGFQGLSPVMTFQLQPGRFPDAARTGVLWLLVTYPLILTIQALVQRFSDDGNDCQLIVRYFLEHPNVKDRGAVMAMAVIVAPIAEEVLFRGYFYGVIRRFGGRIPAILISSLLFAAIHAHLPSLPGLTVLAVILCLLYERTGSLWAPITMHALFNASTVAALLIWPEAVG
jgi:uncharacterized protein